MQVLVIFSLVIAIVAVIFAVQNAGDTTVKFLVWQQEIPLAVGLLLAVLLGALISVFASLPTIFREKLSGRKLRKLVSDTEASLQSEKTKVSESEQKLQEMEELKSELSKQETLLAERQQKIQILQGRLDLEMQKSGRATTGTVQTDKPE